MNVIGGRIASDWTARYPRGEAMIVELVLEDETGAREDLTGRNFFIAILLASGEVAVSRLHSVLADRTGLPVVQLVIEGAELVELYGQAMMRWVVGEIEASGPRTMIEGALVIWPGVGLLVPGASGEAPSIAERFVRRITTAPRASVTVSSQGARGMTPWEALGISLEEYGQRIGQHALGNAIEPTHGVAVAAGRTIIAPAAVPADKPFWVRVTINGVTQRPGLDFTSDGTTTISLTFDLLQGDTWLIEQLQRTSA